MRSRRPAKRFLGSPWAERAAQLGWDIAELFGSRFTTEHLGSSGLLWILAGRQVVQIVWTERTFLPPMEAFEDFHRRPQFKSGGDEATYL
jgi:hypothetical protein